jgi:hypothetical protein
LLFVAIPTVYAGYAVSDQLKLECRSNKLYDYLDKKENWKLQQFEALKNLFRSVEPCVPRRISFRYFFDDPGLPDKSLNIWLKFVSEQPDEGLSALSGSPSEIEKSALIAKLAASSHLMFQNGPRSDFSKALWGDSIYMRVFGAHNFTPVEPAIESSRFFGIARTSTRLSSSSRRVPTHIRA